MTLFGNIIAELNSALLENLEPPDKPSDLYRRIVHEFIVYHNSMVGLLKAANEFLRVFIPDKSIIFNKWVRKFQPEAIKSWEQYHQSLKDLLCWRRTINPSSLVWLFGHPCGKKHSRISLSKVFGREVMGFSFDWESDNNTKSSFVMSYNYPPETIKQEIYDYFAAFPEDNPKMRDFLTSVIKPNLKNAVLKSRNNTELLKTIASARCSAIRIEESIKQVRSYILSHFRIEDLLDN